MPKRPFCDSRTIAVAVNANCRGHELNIKGPVSRKRAGIAEWGMNLMIDKANNQQKKRYGKLSRLEVHSGGYMGPSFSIEKDGNVLLYKTYGSGYSLKKTEKFKPSAQEWSRFWKTCDQIGIWEWQPRYENLTVNDGFSWRVFIEFDHKKFESSGSNDVPNGLNDLTYLGF